MSLFTVGRLCVKMAGRDAGRKCVIVEQLDNTYVVVDGDVRRKRVNIKHLEPLKEIIEIKTKAPHEVVKKAFVELKLPVWEKKSKDPAERPRRQRKVREKKLLEEKSKKAVGKGTKKETKEREESVEELIGESVEEKKE